MDIDDDTLEFLVKKIHLRYYKRIGNLPKKWKDYPRDHGDRAMYHVFKKYPGLLKKKRILIGKHHFRSAYKATLLGLALSSYMQRKGIA